MAGEPGKRFVLPPKPRTMILLAVVHEAQAVVYMYRNFNLKMLKDTLKRANAPTVGLLNCM